MQQAVDEDENKYVIENQNVNEIIKLQMKNRRYKTKRDVQELYFAGRNLFQVKINFTNYPYLSFLWLNNNQLESVEFLKDCWNLSELYLHDNIILSVSECLQHLKSLRVLYLHKNKLQNLESTVAEMKHLQCLEMLNLAHNPLTQEREYRLYVIAHTSPTLVNLDKLDVKIQEKKKAEKLVEPEREFIKDRIAFGKKFLAEPSYLSAWSKKTKPKSIYDKNDDFLPPIPNVQELCNQRMEKKSLSEIKKFDWNKIPRYYKLTSTEERIKAFAEMEPEIVTVKVKM